ncbi:MAG TPA: histidine phosphatase family protein [Geminicoccaceae bacterium]|nr:histidine phosphatase family protein [Geminicoccaceae bacterium]
MRHAQSEWNLHYGRTRVDPGLPDAALTAEGETQARGLVPQLAGRGVERLLVSPYRRTLQTAAIVAGELGLPLRVEPLVRERAVFSCDVGTPPRELERLWPGLDFGHLEERWWGELEESEESLLRRCQTFRAATDPLPDRDRVAVITHYGFILGLTGLAVPNAAIVPLP